jgi:hypothetical protein
MLLSSLRLVLASLHEAPTSGFYAGREKRVPEVQAPQVNADNLVDIVLSTTQ